MLAASPSGGASAVQIKDLTNPAIAPNFEEGDRFQITVWGPPNQPVYRSRAFSGSSSTTQIGQTGSTGHLQLTGAESGTFGTYTDVYTVGSNQAGPVFTYVVAAAGGVGWIASGESAQTPDGSVDGFSYLSISNGTSI
jgi:hypothetical protein